MGHMISMMLKMWMKSLHPVIKMEFAFIHRVSLKFGNFGLINQKKKMETERDFR